MFVGRWTFCRVQTSYSFEKNNCQIRVSKQTDVKAFINKYKYFCFRPTCYSQTVSKQPWARLHSSSALQFTHAHFQPAMVSPSLYAAPTKRPGEAFPGNQVRDKKGEVTDRRHVGFVWDAGESVVPEQENKMETRGCAERRKTEREIVEKGGRKSTRRRRYDDWKWWDWGNHWRVFLWGQRQRVVITWWRKITSWEK